MLRVRQILSSMDSETRSKLKKALPKGALRAPVLETTPYPDTVLGCFPKEECYSSLGILAEHLLRLPAEAIDEGNLLRGIRGMSNPPMTFGQAKAIKEHKTTGPFLESLVETARRLKDALGEEIPLYDRSLQSGIVEGHPDIISATQIFEVKLTGLLEKNWLDFLFQVFAYSALWPDAKRLHIVLPLQGRVWTHEVFDWAGKGEYLEILEASAKKMISTAVSDAVWGASLRDQFRIGSHISKQKTLADTVRGIVDPSKPYQIFLSGPMNTKVSVKDSDIAAASAMVAATGVRLYVHTPYLINLSAKVEGDWNRELLIKNVQIAAAAGCRGVVVHVGKATKQPLPIALESMREALGAAIGHATEECPVLLETPAGQGTETLTTLKDFVQFFQSFKGDRRLRACVDTCHVFACGHNPLKYLEDVEQASPGLTKLVHYNDSATPCGSCVDRHAYMGSGHIGQKGMTEIAEFCGAKGLPMVIE